MIKILLSPPLYFKTSNICPMGLELGLRLGLVLGLEGEVVRLIANMGFVRRIKAETGEG